jgi:hypothetical protein
MTDYIEGKPSHEQAVKLNIKGCVIFPTRMKINPAVPIGKAVCVKPFGAEDGSIHGYHCMKGELYQVQVAYTDNDGDTYVDVYSMAGQWLERSLQTNFVIAP